MTHWIEELSNETMDQKVIPVEEHIKSLLNGDAYSAQCEYFINDEFELPPWFDEKKYKRGQKYMMENLFTQFTNMFSGLVCVLAIPSVLNILINTHKSSALVSAYRRYISTMFHVYSWFVEDLKPGTTPWKSLLTVRTRHARNSLVSRKKGDSFISQLDMVLTQFSFLGVGLLFPEKIGMIHDNEEDIEAYTHFWRTIGYMLGIDDKYNLCRPSLKETKQVFEAVHQKIYRHHLKHPPEHFYYMASTVIRSMWYYNPFLSEGAFLYYTMWLLNIDDYEYKWYHTSYSVKLLTDPKCSTQENSDMYIINNNNTNNNNIKMEVLHKKLSFVNRLLLHLLFFLRDFVTTRFGRFYLNHNTRFTIFLLKNFPFLCFRRFGISQAFIDMFRDDKPIPRKPKTNIEMFTATQFSF